MTLSIRRSLRQVLVLMALIGIALCLASQVACRDAQPRAEQEAKHFIQVILHARQQALREGGALSLHIDADGYRLTRRKGLDWELIGAPQRTALTLRLDVDHRPVPLGGVSQLSISGDAQDTFVLYFEEAGERLACVASDGLNDPRLAC